MTTYDWNEKIDWLTKQYSGEEFSLPARNFGRKKILRQIETQFISRPSDYYDLNNYTPSYANWWSHIPATLDFTLESNLYLFLKLVIDPNKSFWIACEFTGWTAIYKAKVKAILDLIAISYSWTRTFHIIHLRDDYMISVENGDDERRIKVVGSKKMIDKIKQAITSR